MFIPDKNREELIEVLAFNLLTPSEAADLLGISKAAMTNLKNRGTIRPAKLSPKGQSMYLRSDILKYKKHRKKLDEDIPLLLHPGVAGIASEQISIQALASAGLLAIFPARIGAQVYCIGVADGKIIPGKIEKYTNIDADGNGEMEIRMSEDFPEIVSITCSWHEVGRTVFLTEEQARIQILKSFAISTSDGI